MDFFYEYYEVAEAGICQNIFVKEYYFYSVETSPFSKQRRILFFLADVLVTFLQITTSIAVRTAYLIYSYIILLFSF
jgi:hypothetical protein